MGNNLCKSLEISFGKMCPLRCIECSSFVPDARETAFLQPASLEHMLSMLIKMDRLPDSATVSGGEPTMAESVNELLRICIRRFTNVLLLTNGIYFDRLEHEVLEQIETRISVYPINGALVPIFEAISKQRGYNITFRDRPWTTSHCKVPHSDEEAQRLYDKCHLRLHPILYAGRIWQCNYGFPGDEIRSIGLDDEVTASDFDAFFLASRFAKRCKTCAYADMTQVLTAGQPEDYQEIAERIVGESRKRIMRKYGSLNLPETRKGVEGGNTARCEPR